MNPSRVLGETTMILLALLLIPSTAHAQLDPLNLNSSGREFLAVFPENIAHYHPHSTMNKLELTALENDTTFEIETTETITLVQSSGQLSSGQTTPIEIDHQFELNRKPASNKSLRITSNKPIIVRTINSKPQSLQTSLLTSSEKLGNEYKIPPMPSIMAAKSLRPSDVPEEAPFTVIVINSDAENQVQWTGSDLVISLAPFELAQLWMSTLDTLHVVKASEAVSVLFGHPCATIFNCTCGMLVTPLDQVSDTPLTFIIPPEFALNAEAEAVLLIADQRSPLPYDPNKPVVKSVGSVIFHRPGLLLSITPKEHFASCFHINDDLDAKAIVVVHKDDKDLVHHMSDPLSAPDWEPIATTDYVSTTVILSPGKNIFWHPKSLMGVYHMSSYEDRWSGNPAHAISKSTNLKGCVVVPEIASIGDHAMGWLESIEYCQRLGLYLASPDGAELQLLAPKLHARNATLKEMWIGFRRSSLTGDWYRLRGGEVVDTHWGWGEPGTPEEGQCAMMSLDPKKNWSWRDEECCTPAVPLCYKPPILLYVPPTM